MADGKPDRILFRSGFKQDIGKLTQNEPAFLTDTREIAIGDGSPNPPTAPTTKTVGIVNLSSADKYIFKNIDILNNLNGIPIKKFTDLVDNIISNTQNILYDQMADGVHVTVKSATISNPPAGPNAKDVYLIPNNPGGAWVGQAGKLAQKNGTEWVFSDVPVTTIVGVADTGTTLTKTNAGFVNFFASTEEHILHTETTKAATPAGVYSLVQSIIGGGDSGEITPVKYTESATPPANPNVRDYWWDTTRSLLSVWGGVGGVFNWIVISGDNGGDTIVNGNSNADYLLPISWNYATENFSFETFTNDPRYNWRDFGTIGITNTTQGDDSIDLVSTAGIKQGESYLIQDANGSFVQAVEVLSVLSPTRIRVRTDINNNFVTADNATLSRSSFDIGDRFAQAKHNDRMYSKFITTLASDRRGYFVIRRTALGTGTFDVKYRTAGTTAWTDAIIVRNVAVGDSYRDEYYDIPNGGNIQFQLNYYNPSNTAFRETMFHLALTPRTQGVDANRIYKPVNVAPSDQAVSISKTPTLTGSLYRSIYGLAQNGAEFRIAADPKFTNVVASSSTDFLASWVPVAGATADSRALVFLNNRKVVVVGLAGSVRVSTNGGTTYAATTGVSGAVNGICYDSARVHVVAGAVPYYSDDQAANFTVATVTDGFAGTLNAIDNCPGNITIAVGTNAEILRSTNGGVIYQKVAPDNAYAGTLNGIACDSAGNVIIVGNSGEIQTSGNRGATFTKRTNAGNYAGNFTAVSMDDNGNCVVAGANGEIQVSADYGATWTKIVADNSYTGTFYGAYYTNDYGILVGSNGEIQTSKTKGRSWVHRTPASGATGTFRAAAITPDNYALIVGDGGLTQVPLTLTATTSWTVPAGSDFLKDNTLYYWDHRYQDSAGFWSERSDATMFVTTKANINSIKQPLNLAPADGYTNASLTPTLQSSAFGYSGVPDTHQASQWQISRNILFTDIVYDSGDNTTALLNLVVPTALTIGKFYWRVRHKGASAGYSAYSTVTTFTTTAKPNAPTLTQPASNAVISPNAAFTLATSAFSSPVNGDTLSIANYEIADDINFSQTLLKIAAGTTTVNVTPTQLSLAPNKTVYARANHYGLLTDKLSDFSPTVIFKTRAASQIGEAVFVGPAPNVNNPLYVDYEFTVPADVYSVSAVIVAGGAGPLFGGNEFSGNPAPHIWGGAGGGLTYKNNIAVTPGQKIVIRLAQPGFSSSYQIGNYLPGVPGYVPYVQFGDPQFTRTSSGVSSFGNIFSAIGGGWTLVDQISVSSGNGARGSNLLSRAGLGGVAYGGDGGGNGGLAGGGETIQGGGGSYWYTGGAGGAGGYSGKGGKGTVIWGPENQYDTTNAGTAENGAGGAGGGGGQGGGGVGLSGLGNSGLGAGQYTGIGIARKFLTQGQDGSFDRYRYSDFDPTVDGGTKTPTSTTNQSPFTFGAGGGITVPNVYQYLRQGWGGRSGCRIIWGDGRAFPNAAA